MATLLPQSLTRSIGEQAFSLPPEVNPYIWIQERIQQDVLPQLAGQSFISLLWFCFACHVIALAANLATLVLRIKHQRFWLVRFSAIRGGSYLTPNVATLYAIMSSLYCAFALVSMPELIYFSLPYLKKNLILWPLLSLMGLTLCCFIEVWGCLSSILACNDLPSPLLRSKAPLSPLLYNIMAVAAPLIYVAVTIAIVVRLGLFWNGAISNADAMSSLFRRYSGNWSPGTLPDVRVMLEGLPIFNRVNRDFADIVQWIRIATVWQTVMVGILIIAWIPLVITHVKLLGAQIQVLQAMTTSDQQTKLNHSVNTLDLQKSHQKEIQNLVALCRQRVVNAIGVVIMALAYMAVLLIPATQGALAILTPVYYQAFLGGTFMIYSVFGTPISILLLKLSWQIHSGRIGSQKSSGLAHSLSRGADFTVKSHTDRFSSNIPLHSVSPKQDLDWTFDSNQPPTPRAVEFDCDAKEERGNAV